MNNLWCSAIFKLANLAAPSLSSKFNFIVFWFIESTDLFLSFSTLNCGCLVQFYEYISFHYFSDINQVNDDYALRLELDTDIDIFAPRVWRKRWPKTAPNEFWNKEENRRQPVCRSSIERNEQIFFSPQSLIQTKEIWSFMFIGSIQLKCYLGIILTKDEKE